MKINARPQFMNSYKNMPHFKDVINLKDLNEIQLVVFNITCIVTKCYVYVVWI